MRTKYLVYELEISPTRECKDDPPYEVYVGSTYVDENRDVSDRRQEHIEGHNSRVARRGYKVGAIRKVGRLYDSRDEAIEAEENHADALDERGRHVWQA